jgi:hypothetical protein
MGKTHRRTANSDCNGIATRNSRHGKPLALLAKSSSLQKGRPQPLWQWNHSRGNPARAGDQHALTARGKQGQIGLGRQILIASF